MSVLLLRAPSSACRSPHVLQSHLCFVKVWVTLEKYTQKLIGELPFSLSLPPSLLPLPFWIYQNDITHSSPHWVTSLLGARLCELIPPLQLEVEASAAVGSSGGTKRGITIQFHLKPFQELGHKGTVTQM